MSRTPAGQGFARRVALDLFDDEASHALAARSVGLLRARGALGVIPLALDFLATTHLVEGQFDAAERVLDESDAITEVVGESRIGFGRLSVAGLRSDENGLCRLLAAAEAEAIERGEGAVLTFGDHARAVLYNGLGRYEAALPASESAVERDELTASARSLRELVEAAIRCGREELAVDALKRLGDRARAAGTSSALGLEARSRALVSGHADAEALYVDAIDALGRCRVVPELARARLLYGSGCGARVGGSMRAISCAPPTTCSRLSAWRPLPSGLAELAATGEKVRRGRADTRDDLTAQEVQIAELARDGHSNPDIAAQLFLSARTVEWHLRKVFSKLGIRSRRELADALATSRVA